MRVSQPLAKRLGMLGLCTGLLAGSFGSVLAAQACRHIGMAHGARHASPSGGPCLCDDMTGGHATVVPIVEAVPPVLPITIPANSGTSHAAATTILTPDSPSFAPTPPPPNGRSA